MVKKSILVLTVLGLATSAPVFAATTFSGGDIGHLLLVPVADAVLPMSRPDLSRLIGTRVDNAQGQRIGVVETIHINKGNTVSVIVGVGGYLDVGDRDVSIDWDKLQISGNDRKTIKINLSKSELAAMPKFEFSNVKDRGTVYGNPD